jgi:hypothetical protein
MGKVVFEGSEVQLLNVPLTTNSTIDGIDIATDVAANTSKVSNANHSGDVTGDTALTIADNVVTLAKMASGTAGALIVYDGSGDPVDIGVGGAGDVLTSNVGAIATWEAAGAPGAHDLGGASHTSTGQAEFRIVEADGSNGTRWADPAGGTPATTVATSDASTGVVGVDTEYARQDHEHQVVTTGTPGNATPGDTAGAGTSDSLARLDHQHGLPAFGTGSTQFCVGDDARLSDARAPTSHAYDSHSGTVPLADMATGTPGGVIAFDTTTGNPVDVGVGALDQVLTTSTVGGPATWEDSASGVSTWLALSDTDPATYVAQAGKHVRVNATPDGLEFTDPPSIGNILSGTLAELNANVADATIISTDYAAQTFVQDADPVASAVDGDLWAQTTGSGTAFSGAYFLRIP